MTDRVDCVVIGAGVVGLAVGRSLAIAGREVVVVERHASFGEETSSRNSEVIHAGLYYPTGSLKARLCVRGKAMLYDYCVRRQIAHARCGKLIVAADEGQVDRLRAVRRQAEANGVADLEDIDARELRRREPEIVGVAALWSPSTGIVDSHALMQALTADFEAAGGMLALETSVQSIAVRPDDILIDLRSGGESSELAASTVINAAGLGAVALAAACQGIDGMTLPAVHLAKGNYFEYRGTNPFGTLIYPLPADGGLGIHATFDLAGRLRFGPDVEWIDRIDYTIDAGRRAQFGEAIRSYWPTIDEARLEPAYSGIRPKLSGPGEKTADFRIDVAAGGRQRQLVHLFGIESPGLTSALALADAVGDTIAQAAVRTLD